MVISLIEICMLFPVFGDFLYFFEMVINQSINLIRVIEKCMQEDKYVFLPCIFYRIFINFITLPFIIL